MAAEVKRKDVLILLAVLVPICVLTVIAFRHTPAYDKMMRIQQWNEARYDAWQSIWRIEP